MKFIANILFAVKNYCLNSTLAGLSYIADSRFHYTERIFWFLCLVLSIYGSYSLIHRSMADFDESSVSMVVESLQPNDVTYFPSIGVCEFGRTKEVYPALEKIVLSLGTDEDGNPNYDVEDFLLRAIFLNLYNYGSFHSYCSPYQDCDNNCIKCPDKNFIEFADLVRLPCSELIINCTWNNTPFECCRYFLPIKTTLGRCFLLNSIQITERFGKNWLTLKTGMNRLKMEDALLLEFSKSSMVSILNEEDIPHILLAGLHFKQQFHSTQQDILIRVQNIVNDEGVKDISRATRKCIFPNEPFDSKYKYYSFSVCVTECLKQTQIKVCNCTHFNTIYDDNDKSPQCDYNGLECLDKSDLIFPQTTIMQPWRSNGLSCDCLPSCNEHEIKLIGVSHATSIQNIENRRITRIIMKSLPTQRYRRQAVRDNLDIVVSIGGIMGLFLGASILSVVEFLYFFTIRPLKRRI